MLVLDARALRSLLDAPRPTHPHRSEEPEAACPAPMGEAPPSDPPLEGRGYGNLERIFADAPELPEAWWWA